MYAYCLVEYPIKTLDKAFTYIIPHKLKSKIRVGMKVIVPFNNRLIHGIIISISDVYDKDYELKEIVEIEDDTLVLNEELLKLGKYLKEITLCSLITAYQTMLPSSLKIKKQKNNYIKYDKYVYINQDESIIMDYINKHRGKKVDILKNLICNKKVNYKDFDRASLKELEKLLLIKIVYKERYRLNHEKKELSKINLNEEQKIAYKNILDNLDKNITFLLYGITGSGKTIVYLKLIKQVVKENRQVLVLVPEITLTEQIVNIFYDNFGNDVAILHSALSAGEKHDEYIKILKNEVNIVVGTRSAIFAPLNNIGLIIIDEEHSENYKQDNTPRYHAKDIALWRSKYHNCPLVLGSATPSFEAMARAGKKIYKLLTLKRRALNNNLPVIKIIDMKEEVKKRNFIISEELDILIKDRLNNKEQIILLLNRRGFSTIISCSNCGFSYKCPYCDITLTYHKTSNSLRCHYCGYTKIKNDNCPNCNQDGLKYMGMGTEKLEEIIKEKYNARIVRMDADTTNKKGSHEKIIKGFKNLEYDILIGTQMVSKGLDFLECTLVGIINADTAFNIPDFRSSERAFDLLLQASGRAGRGIKEGIVVVQTFNPNITALKCLKNHDYITFYKKEMAMRHMLKYPPYYFLTSIKVCSKNYNAVKKETSKVANFLKRNLDKESILLGPSLAQNFKLKNIYRFNLIIKYRFDKNLLIILKELDNIYATNKDVFIEIDMNPLIL